MQLFAQFFRLVPNLAAKNRQNSAKVFSRLAPPTCVGQVNSVSRFCGVWLKSSRFALFPAFAKRGGQKSLALVATFLWNTSADFCGTEVSCCELFTKVFATHVSFGVSHFFQLRFKSCRRRSIDTCNPRVFFRKLRFLMLFSCRSPFPT